MENDGQDLVISKQATQNNEYSFDLNIYFSSTILEPKSSDCDKAYLNVK